MIAQNKMIPFNSKQSLEQVDEREQKALAAQIFPLFPKDCSKEQAMLVARLAILYGLDPLAEEIIPYQGKPYITLAGRLRKAHESGLYQGIIEDREATEAEYKANRVNSASDVLWYVSIKRADWIRPNGRFGRASKTDRNFVAREDPALIARKRAHYRCIKDGFIIRLPGVYDNEDVAVAPEGQPDETPAVMMANEGQIGLIHAFRKDLALTEERYRTILLHNYGVNSSTEMTEFQAEDFLTWLEAQKAMRQNGTAIEPTKAMADLDEMFEQPDTSRSPQPAVKAEVVPATPPTPHQDDDDKPATKAMLDRWVAICQQAAELGVPDLPAVPADIKAGLLTTLARNLKVRIAERETELQANQQTIEQELGVE